MAETSDDAFIFWLIRSSSKGNGVKKRFEESMLVRSILYPLSCTVDELDRRDQCRNIHHTANEELYDMPREM